MTTILGALVAVVIMLMWNDHKNSATIKKLEEANNDLEARLETLEEHLGLEYYCSYAADNSEGDFSPIRRLYAKVGEDPDEVLTSREINAQR